MRTPFPFAFAPTGFSMEGDVVGGSSESGGGRPLGGRGLELMVINTQAYSGFT